MKPTRNVALAVLTLLAAAACADLAGPGSSDPSEGQLADTEVPVLAGFTLGPSPVERGGTLEFLAAVKDPGAGVKEVRIFTSIGERFNDPGPDIPGLRCTEGTDLVPGTVFHSTLSSGTANDGVWKCSMKLVRDDFGAGTYAVTFVEVEDQAGNRRGYDRDALAAAGFATQVVVTTAPTPP